MKMYCLVILIQHQSSVEQSGGNIEEMEAEVAFMNGPQLLHDMVNDEQLLPSQTEPEQNFVVSF